MLYSTYTLWQTTSCPFLKEVGSVWYVLLRIVNALVHNFLMFLEIEVKEDKNVVRRTKMKIDTKKCSGELRFLLAFELVHFFCTSSNKSTHNYLLYMALVVAFYTTTASLKMAAQSRWQDVDKKFVRHRQFADNSEDWVFLGWLAATYVGYSRPDVVVAENATTTQYGAMQAKSGIVHTCVHNFIWLLTLAQEDKRRPILRKEISQTAVD